jgi:DNA-binding response OmpR family regulator
MGVLVVDDDSEIRSLVVNLLEAEGYEARSVSTGTEALAVVAADEPELIVLDVALGAEDGRDLLREIRLVSDVPVVFLSGRGLEFDRIAGLKMGADDYIVKPFSTGELLARVESVLRRSRRTASVSPEVAGGTSYGELRIDTVTREVAVRGELVDLTAKEFDLLAFLAASPRQVFSRGQLLERVWASSREWQDEATVTEHVRRIRRKLENDPDHPAWVTTVRGVGYRFEPARPADTRPPVVVHSPGPMVGD